MFFINKDLCINCGRCIAACPRGVFHRDKSGSVIARDTPCMNCFHCTAACPAKAIGNSEHEECYPIPAPNGSLIGRIQRRRSIRSFKEDAPDAALIQSALDGAAWAPSAKNQQVCRWTVVLGKEKTEEVYQKALEWAKGQRELRYLVWLGRQGSNPITCGAPCLILCHAPADSHNPVIDGAIASTLVEQLLVEQGLGTCWAGYLARMADASSDLRKLLGIPEGHQVVNALMVGIPAEVYPNVPPRGPASIHWVK